MLIKGQSGELLEIKVLCRSDENATNDSDANWLDAEVTITVPSFTAVYGASLRADDFARFYEAITKVRSGAAQEAQFTTTEEWLSFHIKQQKTGSLVVSGKADNHSGNRLEFSFIADNIALDHMANEVREILKKYPVIGKP